METAKKTLFTEILTIKKIHFQTGMKGMVYPVIEFFETQNLKNHKINAAIFTDMNVVANINKGVRAKFEFDEDLLPTMKNIIRGCEKPISMPTHCLSCETKLETGTKHPLVCPNKLCPATARGFIYRLIRLAAPTYAYELIELYLNEYVYKGDKISIDNPTEFKIVFSQIPDKFTQAVENEWKRLHPKNGEMLASLDVKVQNYLTKKEHGANEFWSICNFPKLQEPELYELSSLDPQKHLDGELKTEFMALSPRVKTLLMNNHDFIVFLNDLFISFGEKTWKPLKKSSVDVKKK